MPKFLLYRLTYLGDVLMTTSFIHTLKIIYPKCTIDYIVGPIAATTLKGNSDLHNIFIYDRKNKHKTLLSRLRFITKIRENNYDVVFILARSFSSALFTAFSQIPQRIGFNTEGRKFLLTKAIYYDRKKNEYDCFYDLLAGYLQRNDFPKFYKPYLNIEDSSFSHPQVKPYIAMHMVSHPAKTWPVANAEETIKLLLKHFPTHDIVLVGGKDNVKAAQEVQTKLKSTCIYNYTGITSYPQSSILIKNAALFIGIDSSLAHVAAAFETPKIILFGPTSSLKWGYKNDFTINLEAIIPCRPCYPKVCSSVNCMKAIKPTSILTSVKALLSK